MLGAETPSCSGWHSAIWVCKQRVALHAQHRLSLLMGLNAAAVSLNNHRMTR